MITGLDHIAIAVPDLEAAIEVSYENTIDIEWRKGDIALLDNLKVMHGRRSFEGTRSVLAALCSPIARPALGL